ncbi:MAG: Tm-1-like ATP-binding domain-containing protein, partial [Pseudomonadota bacterium]
MTDKTILVVGTFDTKDDELHYLAERIQAQGGGVLTMDVSILGEPSQPCDINKDQVAKAANSSIAKAAQSGDENSAMQIMARGAVAEATRLQREGK